MCATYVCPGCGKVTDDCETYSYCLEYHGDHPESITTPKNWDDYIHHRYNPNKLGYTKEQIDRMDYEMNEGRKAYNEGMADW